MLPIATVSQQTLLLLSQPLPCLGLLVPLFLLLLLLLLFHLDGCELLKLWKAAGRSGLKKEISKWISSGLLSVYVYAVFLWNREHLFHCLESGKETVGTEETTNIHKILLICFLRRRTQPRALEKGAGCSTGLDTFREKKQLSEKTAGMGLRLGVIFNHLFD